MKKSEAIKILDLTVPFTAENARKSYRRLAMFTHPDKGGSVEIMVELNQAYELVSKGISMPDGPKMTSFGAEFKFDPKIKSQLNYGSVIKWFGIQMLNKLHANRHKDKEFKWTKERSAILYNNLLKECKELAEELDKTIKDKEAIIKECADIGSFAMMIADNARRKL